MKLKSQRNNTNFCETKMCPTKESKPSLSQESLLDYLLNKKNTNCIFFTLLMRLITAKASKAVVLSILSFSQNIECLI